MGRKNGMDNNIFPLCSLSVDRNISTNDLPYLRRREHIKQTPEFVAIVNEDISQNITLSSLLQTEEIQQRPTISLIHHRLLSYSVWSFLTEYRTTLRYTHLIYTSHQRNEDAGMKG